jgi:hypothetical protein
LADLGLQSHRDYDPHGLLLGTRERWAHEAAEREAARRRAEAEAKEARRRAALDRELQDAMLEARQPVERMNRRAWQLSAGLLLVASTAAVVWTYGEIGGWGAFALVAGLWWLFPKAIGQAVRFAVWARRDAPRLKRREEAKIAHLGWAAEQALARGSTLKAVLDGPARRSTLPCKGCGVGLRLPSGHKGSACCPQCGRRDYYDTRTVS